LYVQEYGFRLESRTKHKSLPEGRGKVWTVKEFGNQKKTNRKEGEQITLKWWRIKRESWKEGKKQNDYRSL
jgi:hypothetical protein